MILDARVQLLHVYRSNQRHRAKMAAGGPPGKIGPQFTSREDEGLGMA